MGIQNEEIYGVLFNVFSDTISQYSEPLFRVMVLMKKEQSDYIQSSLQTSQIAPDSLEFKNEYFPYISDIGELIYYFLYFSLYSFFNRSVFSFSLSNFS